MDNWVLAAGLILFFLSMAFVSILIYHVWEKDRMAQIKYETDLQNQKQRDNQ